jgi:5-methylcytosine-specific restriction endonuclease McrA
MKPDLSWIDKVKPVPYGNVNRFGGKLDIRGFETLSKKKKRVVIPQPVPDYPKNDLWKQNKGEGQEKRKLAKYRPLICFYCDESHALVDLTRDHVIPRSKGGTSSIKNQVFACYHCNQVKGNRLPTEAELKKLETWRLTN